MKIVWDEPKRLANLDKHALDFAAIEPSFFRSAVIRPSHSGRLLAFGRCQGRPIAVVFRMLGSEGISVISMRPARLDERRLIR